MKQIIAMDYIKSKEIFLLLRDTLKLIDPRPVDHGYRVAYIIYKMFRLRGGFEEFELADYVMLATFHDLGAYKTENLNDMLRYEAKVFMPHSIYGYLFYKYMCPVPDGDWPKTYLYHHMDYNQLQAMPFKYKKLVAYLNIAERMDIYNTALGDKFDYTMFQKHADIRISGEGLDFFYRAEKKDHILENLRNGNFHEELDQITQFLVFTNEYKTGYLEMLMYFLGFRSPTAVVDAVTCIHISLQIGRQMNLSEKELDILKYAAMVHDIGMLAIPKEIIDAPRKLSAEEVRLLRTHVERTEKLLRGRMSDEVVDIALAHHERSDGSGYPKGLRSASMNLQQSILQVADTVAGLVNDRSYRTPHSKNEVISILQEEVKRGKYSKAIVNVFCDRYDEIMETVKAESENVLATYDKLNKNYDLVSSQFKNTK
ncbi:MAG: HD domain-containing protein [Lachnospiraceae bacterium]|nr:HD domain-containing protein [Lachnospiraceae bacterium]